MAPSDWQQLQTAERIRYDRAQRTAMSRKKKYEEAKAAYTAAAEELRAALAEQTAALRALRASQRIRYCLACGQPEQHPTHLNNPYGHAFNARTYD